MNDMQKLKNQDSYIILKPNTNANFKTNNKLLTVCSDIVRYLGVYLRPATSIAFSYLFSYDICHILQFHVAHFQATPAVIYNRSFYPGGRETGVAS